MPKRKHEDKYSKLADFGSWQRRLDKLYYEVLIQPELPLFDEACQLLLRLKQVLNKRNIQ